MPGQDGSWKKGQCPEYAGGENVNRLGEPKGWPAVSPEFSIRQKGISRCLGTRCQGVLENSHRHNVGIITKGPVAGQYLCGAWVKDTAPQAEHDASGRWPEGDRQAGMVRNVQSLQQELTCIRQSSTILLRSLSGRGQQFFSCTWQTRPQCPFCVETGMERVKPIR
jgi:hypothetical protein